MSIVSLVTVLIVVGAGVGLMRLDLIAETRGVPMVVSGRTVFYVIFAVVALIGLLSGVWW